MANKFSSHTLVINQLQNQILLVQRNDFPVWVLPGGRSEENETPEQVAIRECKEETGYQISALTNVACYLKDTTIIKYVYITNTFSGNIIPNNEAKNIRWFPIDQLPSPMTLYELSKIKDGINYKGEIIHRADEINYKQEIINLIITPTKLIKLLPYIVSGRKYLFKTHSK